MAGTGSTLFFGRLFWRQLRIGGNWFYIILRWIVFLQNNPVFSCVTIFHLLKNENYELCFLANFFVNHFTTGKKYDRKKGSVLVFWPAFSSVTIFHILKSKNYELCFLAGFFVDDILTGKNYDRKKRYYVSCFGWA